jgi:hypothetical protein
MPRRVCLLAAAFWWGSLAGIGFIAVPLLFAHLPTPAQAGQVAARLFTAQCWVSLTCGGLVLIWIKGRAASAGNDRSHGTLMLVVAAMLLALLIEYVAAPHIRAREQLRLWHTLGSAMYVLQWLCVAAVLWQFSKNEEHTT